MMKKRGRSKLKPGKPVGKEKPAAFDIAKLKAEIEKKIKIVKNLKKKSGKVKKITKLIIDKKLKGKSKLGFDGKKQLLEQREPVAKLAKLKDKKTQKASEYIKTGVPGFDDLFEKGIPKGNTVLVAGGAGSGKTIFCLQLLVYHAAKGEK